MASSSEPKKGFRWHNGSKQEYFAQNYMVSVHYYYDSHIHFIEFQVKWIKNKNKKGDHDFEYDVDLTVISTKDLFFEEEQGQRI